MREGARVKSFAAIAWGLVVLTAVADDRPQHSAVKAAPRDQGWLQRHEKYVRMARKGHIDVLFLGDSITDDWGGEGHAQDAPGAKIFAAEFEPLHAANFGMDGDRTQHVLWRLQNGELEGIHPKVVMLMIGTNNSNRNDNTAEEIADGIKAIVRGDPQAIAADEGPPAGRLPPRPEAQPAA